MTNDTANLLDSVLRAIPAKPVAFRNGDAEGYGWMLPDGKLAYLAVTGDGKPLAGSLEVYGERKGRPIEALCRQGLHDSVLRRDPSDAFDLGEVDGDEAESPWAGPERDVFAGRLAAAVDMEALGVLMRDGRGWDAVEYGWTTSGNDRARRMRVASGWPWAIGCVAKAEFLGLVDEGVGDDAEYLSGALVGVARSLGQPGNAEAARLLLHPMSAGTLRHFQGDRALDLVGLASAFPPAWLPVPPASGDGKGRLFVEELRAFLCLGGLARDYALATGQRVMDCLSLEGEGWVASTRRLLARAGVADGIIDRFGVAEAVDCLVQRVTDMVRSFENQVVHPAVRLETADWEDNLHGLRLYMPGRLGGIDWTDRSRAEGFGATTRAALRILAGDKSLAGTVELSRDWHNNIAPVAEAAARAAAGRSWGAAFRQRVEGGLTFRCLTTPGELVEEGRAMRNCVATYLGPCMDRSSCIVSVTDGGGHVATVELVRDEQGAVVANQVSGPGNGKVPDSVVEAVMALLSGITSGHVPFDHDVLEADGGFGTEMPMLDGYVGMFPEIVSAWGPFLPRDLRDASARSMLEASGYDGASHARRRQGLLGRNATMPFPRQRAA